MIRRCLRLFFLIALSLAVVANVRLYLATDACDSIAQLRFLREALNRGAPAKMQALFPEGHFFMYALYGSAWIEIGRSETDDNSPLRIEARNEAAWALGQLDAPEAKAPFPEHAEPPYGIFYAAWINWLRGGLLSLESADKRDEALRQRLAIESARIAAAFDASDTPFLRSYADGAWPVDSVVGAASLRLHDRLLAPRFGATISRWRGQVEKHIDLATGLIPHRIDPNTGSTIEGPRGSSQALLLRFLMEIDAEVGRRHYLAFRSRFVPPAYFVPGTREHPIGIDREGDVDSGPLFMGISLSASVVHISSARLVSDDGLTEPYLHIGEALGMPVMWDGTRRYLFGQLPIADAFLVYARTATPWVERPDVVTEKPIVSAGWRIGWHVVTVGIPVLGLWLTRPRRTMSY